MVTSNMTLFKSLAILQHHDAITGTEKEHVANDYEKMLRYVRNNFPDRVFKKVKETALSLKVFCHLFLSKTNLKEGQKKLKGL